MRGQFSNYCSISSGHRIGRRTAGSQLLLLLRFNGQTSDYALLSEMSIARLLPVVNVTALAGGRQTGRSLLSIPGTERSAGHGTS